jgi:glycosyltransferase involved in cell wall biosynthesis
MASLGIVMFANESWEAVGVRQRELATWLSERWDVLFVDRFNYRRFPLRHRQCYRQLIVSLRTPRQIKPRLWHWTPPPLFSPGWRQRWVPLLNRAMLKPLLMRALRNIGMNEFILFCCGHTDEQFVGSMGEICALTDVTDEVTGFANTDPQLAAETERHLLKKVHIALTTAPSLYESKRHLVRECYLVRNGVTPERFRPALENRLPLPDDIKMISHPRIGFVGVIAEWVDIDLLVHVASMRPQWSFVLVGPIKKSIALSDLPPNVHLLGPKPYDMVPAYLQGIDVAIIPFERTEFITRYVNPIKLYEYLAAGKPVVTTPMGDYDGLETFVHIAETPEAFASAIEVAMKETAPQFKEARWQAILDRSWQVRANQVDVILRTHLQRCHGLKL